MCDLENIIFLLITKYPEIDAIFPNFFFVADSSFLWISPTPFVMTIHEELSASSHSCN